MPKGPVITVPLVGTYTAPKFDNGQAKPPSGKMRQMDVEVSEQQVSRKKIGTGDLKVIHYDDDGIGPRFMYVVKRMDPKQVLDLTDIAPGEHVHLDMSKAHVKNSKELRVKVWDGVKVTAGDDGRFTKIHVDTVSGDHFKAHGTVQISGDPKINYNGLYQFSDPRVNEDIQIKGKWVKDDSETQGEEPTVWCRHLATASIKFRQAGGVSWKDERKWFTPEKMSKVFDFREAWEQDARDIYNLTAKSFTSDTEIFGQVLGERLKLLADELKGDGKIEKNLYTALLVPESSTGDNHAVHIVLQVKRENGQETYKVKLFDPNKTMAHFTFAADNLEYLYDKTLSDLGVNYGDFFEIECAEVPDNWSQETNEETRSELSLEQTQYSRSEDGGLDALVVKVNENERMMAILGFEKMNQDDEDNQA